MRRTFFVGALVSVGIAMLGPTALAADSADDCVAINKSESPDGIDFELKNNCAKPLACNLAWTLSCENDKGKVTSTARASASFGVAKDTAKHTNGSAAACKTSGWRIDDVTWSCTPTSK